MNPVTRTKFKAVARVRLALAVAACIAQTAIAADVDNAELLIDESGQPSAVGEVSLVLGRAYVESVDGSRQLLSSGSPVYAQDRIFTETNGHVHIRFVDQALVSVRPDSQLEIVQYDFNPDQPRLSSIKLNLQEGVTRSISGQGATSARERFRLNTPIAAIGVRGTDFVVSATGNGVRAVVNEGAIVLAPYSAGCTADSFGPCVDNAIELSHTSLQMIEFDAGTNAPRLLSADATSDTDMLDATATVVSMPMTEEVGSEEKAAGTDAYLENVTSRQVEAVASETLKPPVVVEPTPLLTDRQLVWGRHASGLNTLTVPYQVAADGREVAVNLGLSSNYTLFREGNGSDRIQSGLGLVSFELANAQASYHSASGVVAMSVGEGALDINFDNNTFATSLSMSHDLTGDVNFTAAGVLNSNGSGFFNSRTKTERMTGAVSMDGKEASYYFEKQLEAGGIQGLTLWDMR